MSKAYIATYKRVERNPGGETKDFYIQFMSKFRDYVHLFSNGKNSNPLTVFIVLALHQNDNGWAWPLRTTIQKETGLRTNNAVAEALSHLRTITIDGQPILRQYRRVVNNVRGACYYHIFPAAGGADQYPVDGLIPWDGTPEGDEGELITDTRGMDNPSYEPGADEPSAGANGGENSRGMDNPYEEELPIEETPSTAASPKSPVAQSSVSDGPRIPIARKKDQGPLGKSMGAAASPLGAPKADRPISTAEQLIARKFGKDKLTRQVAELLDKDILGADGEAHFSLNELATYDPDKFPLWIDREFDRWWADGGREGVHFVNRLRKQSAAAYKPVSFDDLFQGE